MSIRYRIYPQSRRALLLSRTRVSFTLIEALIVILILTIFTIIIFSISRSTLQSAKAVKNTQNLRGLGYACLSYANDHNGFLPTHTIGGKTQMTIGDGLMSGGVTLKLFNVGTFGIGQGDFDYITNIDILYSPFAEKIARNRIPGSIYEEGGRKKFGYFHISMPHNNQYDPTKSPLVDGLFNERLTDSPRAPLWCDMISFADEVQYSSDRFYFVRMDGSVGSLYRKDTPVSWSAIIKIMADMPQ